MIHVFQHRKPKLNVNLSGLFMFNFFLVEEKSRKINVLIKKEKSAFTQSNNMRGVSNIFWKIKWKNDNDIIIYQK